MMMPTIYPEIRSEEERAFDAVFNIDVRDEILTWEGNTRGLAIDFYRQRNRPRTCTV
jgi:hypothetical protein